MTLVYPFVNFRMTPTLNVGSTPTLIFGSQNTCAIEGIVLANQTESPITVSVYVLRESHPTPGAPTEYLFANKVSIEALDRIDILLGLALTLEATDLLFAYSDFSSTIFNTFVSYRELTELPLK